MAPPERTVFMSSRLLAWLRASALVVVVLLMAATSSGLLHGLGSYAGSTGRAPAVADSSLEILPVSVASAQDDNDAEDNSGDEDDNADADNSDSDDNADVDNSGDDDNADVDNSDSDDNADVDNSEDD